uniref:Uncharacterized protein n=1 Tax=Anguilla anguilla TaxID=7936 RepID=A0A0E9UEX1_ANGAN
MDNQPKAMKRTSILSGKVQFPLLPLTLSAPAQLAENSCGIQSKFLFVNERGGGWGLRTTLIHTLSHNDGKYF